MDREDKRGIFFGVIGVLTLIVAIIGASLAYFSINANSEPDALTVQAATVQIVYKDGGTISVEDIIPSKKDVALETYRRYLAKETYTVDLGEGQTQVQYEKCIDDKNNTVCGVYEFYLTNNGVNPVNITAKVVPTELGEDEIAFKNLKFSLYDITKVAEGSTDYGTAVVSDGSITYETFNLLPAPISIAGEGKQVKYRLFIWLDEQNVPQNEEQGATFKGTVHIEVPNANTENNGQITGTVSGMK